MHRSSSRWSKRVVGLSLISWLWACSGSTPTTDGGSGGGGGSNTSALELLSTAQVVGATWAIPLNSATASLAIYSEQREPFTLRNKSGHAVTVTAVTLTPGAENLADEWALQKYDITAQPLVAAGQSLAADGTLDFYVRAYPMVGQQRTATLSITTDVGALTVALSVRGAPDSAWASGTTAVSERVLGTPNGEEQPGGLVVNAAGDTFVSANVNFSTNAAMMVARANANGTLAWAKSWDGAFTDRSRDPGQNGESGGPQGSLGADTAGNLYLAGASSTSNANSLYRGALARIDADGAMTWQKLWGYGTPTVANQNAELYGVDATGSTLYAVGTTGGAVQNSEALVLLLAVDPATGALKASKAFDLNPTYNDRGYAVRADGQGNVYLGGNGNGRAWLMKVSAADTTQSVAWAKELPIGIGGNVNALDVDAAGNLYAALDVRGSITTIAVARFAPDGTLAWARQIAGIAGDKNNVHAVRVVGDKLWVGGRLGGIDGQMGDGWVGRFTLDGVMDWSAFHYSGKGPDELAEHRVKGLQVQGNDVFLVSQVYTGSLNGVRYHGAWYTGQAPAASYNLAPTNTTAKAEIALPSGAFVDAASLLSWSPVPTTLVLQSAADKHDGVAPDADLMITHLQVQ